MWGQKNESLFFQFQFLSEMAAASAENVSSLSADVADVDCVVWGTEDEALMAVVNFWVEGVVQTSLAIPGIVGECTTGL